MKRLLVIVTSITLSTQILAADLLCTLRTFSLSPSIPESSTVVLNLNNTNEIEEGKTSDYVGDLSFYISAACEGVECQAAVWLFSNILEDEISSFGFDFKKQGRRHMVFQQHFENDLDSKTYNFRCHYRK